MLRLVTLSVVGTVALAVVGCATAMNVSSYVDRSVDFARYRTYDWGPADALPTGDPRLDKDPFFQDHMQGAVEKQLAAKGLGRVTSGEPDLLIHYHASITQRIDVNRPRRQAFCVSGILTGGGVFGRREPAILPSVRVTQSTERHQFAPTPAACGECLRASHANGNSPRGCEKLPRCPRVFD